MAGAAARGASAGELPGEEGEEEVDDEKMREGWRDAASVTW
jgi:hypothetical protein